MPSFSLQQATNWTNGSCTGHGQIKHVTIDSRTASAGSLFVALPGENVDGHDFVPDVLSLGGFAIVKRGSFTGPHVIQVDDPIIALGLLAKGYLTQFSIPVVAVTGSNGKTSTKDMIAHILQSKYRVHKTTGNYNNELGLPLTVLALEEEHEVLIVEMGMRGLGQISKLAEICQPTIGVVTNIGPVHLEVLGSMERIASAKGELLEALGLKGTAILNGDDLYVREQAQERMQGRIIYYGQNMENDVQISRIGVDALARPTFEVTNNTEPTHCQLGVSGIHNVWNACAALAVGNELGIPFADGARLLADVNLSEMRLEVQRTLGGAVVINDAYNASPASMKAALDTLSQMKADGKKIAILGSMLELGDISFTAHKEIGEYARRHSDLQIFVGEWAEVMQSDAENSRAFVTVEDLLHNGLQIGAEDVVLIKASRGLKLERVAELLVKGRNEDAN